MASASSARAAILREAAVPFEVRPSDVDEQDLKRRARSEGWAVADLALALAEAKALTAAATRPDSLVLGADQILDCAGTWFDKPADRTAAGEHLRALRGRTHRLVTALAAVRDGHVVWRVVAEPRLTMRGFSDTFLDTYLENAEPEILESVGAYRLEGLGVQLFAHIDGDYFAILGLPLLPLLDFLREEGYLGT